MIRHHTPSDPDAILARLSRKLDALTADVGDVQRLRTDVETHTRTLADLSDLLRALTDGSHAIPAAGDASGDREPLGGPFDEPVPDSADSPQPHAGHSAACAAPDWLTVTDPALAIAWLNALAVWVRRVWTRYGPIPPCWPWHPVVVAELLVTYHQWLVATGHGAGPDLLAVWHDRWRPGVAARTGKWLQACERAGGHVGAGSTHWRTDPTYLDELAHWWTTTNPHPDTPDTGSAPGLIRDTSW